ncbi:MAG: hypothetical protein EOR72_31105 [Mesorhizobium sp.]|nr:MAG: hypothetical protein EOR72_31105 [Mesorhizobium sp.]
MVRNLGDWSVAFLFEQIGALTCSRDRFARLIEAALHPLGRRGPDQVDLVTTINAVLRRDGYELKVDGEESGYPLYRLAPIALGVAGAPKNLIFASNCPKPEIGFSDAINNDIVILSNAASCLVYDRPIRRDGLLWSELVDWWVAGPGIRRTRPSARRAIARIPRLGCRAHPLQHLLQALPATPRRRAAGAHPAGLSSP